VRRSDSTPDLPRAVCFSRLLGSLMGGTRSVRILWSHVYLNAIRRQWLLCQRNAKAFRVSHGHEEIVKFD